MNFRQFAPDRRSYRSYNNMGAEEEGLPSMSIYGSSPDSAPAMAWLQRQRSESDMDEAEKKQDLAERQELKRRQQQRLSSLSSPMKPHSQQQKEQTLIKNESSTETASYSSKTSSDDATTRSSGPATTQKKAFSSATKHTNKPPIPPMSSSTARLLAEEESKGSIEVVSDTVVSYGGMARMAPSWVQTVQDTSPVERMEKCNSCEDLLKVFNGATNSWDLLRGKDLRSWETVSNK